MDAYTTVATSNDINGGYTHTTSGSGDYTLIESDDGGVPVTTDSSHTFSTTSAGNYVDGNISLSATGVDHYHLLRQFQNTSNAGSGTAGTVDYSPVGAGMFLGFGVEGPTGGGARAAATNAVFGDLGAMPYQHCFAAGTPVLMADGSFKSIELVQAGDLVLAVSDRDPEGPVEVRRVVKVFHNPPSRILELHVALIAGSPLLPGEGQGVRACGSRSAAQERRHLQDPREKVAGTVPVPSAHCSEPQCDCQSPRCAAH